MKVMMGFEDEENMVLYRQYNIATIMNYKLFALAAIK
jgi:hypothetical protein